MTGPRHLPAPNRQAALASPRGFPDGAAVERFFPAARSQTRSAPRRGGRAVAASALLALIACACSGALTVQGGGASAGGPDGAGGSTSAGRATPWFDPRSVDFRIDRVELQSRLGPNAAEPGEIETFPRSGPDFDAWPRRQGEESLAVRYNYAPSGKVASAHLSDPMGMGSWERFEAWRATYRTMLGKETRFDVELKCKNLPPWETLSDADKSSNLQIGCAAVRTRWELADRRVDLIAASLFFGLTVEPSTGDADAAPAGSAAR